MQPIPTAWLIFLLPLLVVNAAWLWSSLTGAIEWCIPYWDGCTSISRAARSSDALFLFRAVMILTAMLLVNFWLHVGQFLTLHHRPRKILIFIGVIAALFLVLYANFLGTQGKAYQLLRQYGVTVYFAFTVLAHMLFIRDLLAMNINATRRAVKGMFWLSGWLLLLGITSVFCNALLIGDAKDRWENIIEWHFALGMTCYFLLVALIWGKLGFHHQAKLRSLNRK